MNIQAKVTEAEPPRKKFEHPDVTVTGEPRASVPLHKLETLWFNTGTVCNIECVNCYIESSPTNDRLVYLKTAEVVAYLDEVAAENYGTREIGFTGGESFMNPDIIPMLGETLLRGFDVLVLTNAMQPMQRPRVKEGLLELREKYGDKLILRVSLDHHTKALHEKERGNDTWDKAVVGLDWLTEHKFRTAIAGRTCWGEDEADERRGYAELIRRQGWTIDPEDPAALVLLPEMEPGADVPEITASCWGILGKRPRDIMCATSRMVVKRKGAGAPIVLPCTLIPYDTAFDGETTLAETFAKDGGMYRNGAIKLCHVNCAKFCVLGGGSCS